MQLKLIRTRKDYRAALAEAERLWDAPARSEQADQLLHTCNSIRTNSVNLEAKSL